MEACICIDVGDYATPYCQRYYTARKEHICCECGETINPGDKYEQVNGCWDGDWFTFKTCSVCRRIRDDLFNCGYIHALLYEHIAEHYGRECIDPNYKEVIP